MEEVEPNNQETDEVLTINSCMDDEWTEMRVEEDEFIVDSCSGERHEKYPVFAKSEMPNNDSLSDALAKRQSIEFADGPEQIIVETVEGSLNDDFASDNYSRQYDSISTLCSAECDQDNDGTLFNRALSSMSITSHAFEEIGDSNTECVMDNRIHRLKTHLQHGSGC